MQFVFQKLSHVHDTVTIHDTCLAQIICCAFALNIHIMQGNVSGISYSESDAMAYLP